MGIQLVLKKIYRSYWPYLILSPSLALVCLTSIYPALQAFYESFFVSGPKSPREFVGFGNYFQIAASQTFHYSVLVTLYSTGVSTCMEIILGLIAALVLNERIVARGIFRSIILIVPWSVTRIVNALLWKGVFSSVNGALNGLLFQLGIIESYISWLAEPLSALNCAIFASVWVGFPFMGLVFLAAMQGIPTDLYDAASVDGAGTFQRFKNVTLPLIRPAVAVAIIAKTLWTFREFDIIYVMTLGGPARATELLSLHLYRETFLFMNFGYGYALCFVMLLISAGVVAVYVRMIYKTTGV